MSRPAARVRFLCVSIAALSLAAACSEPAPPPPPPAPAPVVKTTEQRVQMYQACWDQFNNKAWDQFQNCYAENAVSEIPDGNPPSLTGRAAIIEQAKREVPAFPDRRGEPKLILTNGERIAAIALYTATNTGAFPPGPDGKAQPATNKAVGLLIAHTIELDSTGAMATREAAYVDESTLTAQLGLNPMPARPAAKATGEPATVVIAKNDDKEHANVDAVRKTFAALNAHDAKGLMATLAENYRVIESARPTDLNKKQAEASTKELFSGFPDVRITPVTMWAAGDYVVVSGTFEGTNTGDMPSMQLKKTGKKVSLHFFEVFKVENGLCTEDWLFFNSAAFMAQLGVK
jgi:predicted ester cyclase